MMEFNESAPAELQKEMSMSSDHENVTNVLCDYRVVRLLRCTLQ